MLWKAEGRLYIVVTQQALAVIKSHFVQKLWLTAQVCVAAERILSLAAYLWSRQLPHKTDGRAWNLISFRRIGGPWARGRSGITRRVFVIAGEALAVFTGRVARPANKALAKQPEQRYLSRDVMAVVWQ